MNIYITDCITDYIIKHVPKLAMSSNENKFDTFVGTVLSKLIDMVEAIDKKVETIDEKLGRLRGEMAQSVSDAMSELTRTYTLGEGRPPMEEGKGGKGKGGKGKGPPKGFPTSVLQQTVPERGVPVKTEEELLPKIKELIQKDTSLIHNEVATRIKKKKVDNKIKQDNLERLAKEIPGFEKSMKSLEEKKQPLDKIKKETKAQNQNKIRKTLNDAKKACEEEIRNSYEWKRYNSESDNKKKQEYKKKYTDAREKWPTFMSYKIALSEWNVQVKISKQIHDAEEAIDNEYLELFKKLFPEELEEKEQRVTMGGSRMQSTKGVVLGGRALHNLPDGYDIADFYPF